MKTEIGILVVAVGLFGWIWYDLATGRIHANPGPPGQTGASSQTVSVASTTDTTPAQGVRAISTLGSEAPPEARTVAPSGEGQPPSAAIYAASTSLDPRTSEGFLPGQAGLRRMTLERWSQEGFLALTTKEARALLPLDDTLTSAPGSLVEVYGLPSEVDVDAAYVAPGVAEALERVLLLELAYVRVLEIPAHRRSASFEETVLAQKAITEAARRDLMVLLDKTSGFKNWSVLNRAFVEWDSE